MVGTVRLNTAVLRQSTNAQEQKTGADNRTQWWTRYMWAEELRLSKDPARQLLGWSHLNILIASPFTTESEQDVLIMLALGGPDDNNGPHIRNED